MRSFLAFQQDPDPFQIISSFLESPILRISGQLVLLLFIVLWVSLVYWTYADASRRGAMSVLWGFIAFIFPYVGPLVYLIVRRRVPRTRAGAGRAGARAHEQRPSVPQLPQPGREGLPDLPFVHLGAQEVLPKLRKTTQHGVGDVPLLRHRPAQRQDHR
jgi:hypothetical protein